MKRFKITYINGVEYMDAKNIFEVAECLKRRYAKSFNMPIAIEEDQSYWQG